jgi:superfamily I DNA/RNA helicase
MKPTDEQQEIVDVFSTGSDLVVEAGAGVGKTSVLRMLGQEASYLGRNGVHETSGVFLAFNKAVAVEAQRSFPRNVACSTAHSLAFRAVREHPSVQRLGGQRVTARQLAEDHLGITKWVKMPRRKPISTWKVASLAVETVQRFCRSDDREVGPQHVPLLEGADMEVLREAVTPFAREVWEDLQRPDGFAQYSHDHYMKLWALSDPRIEADFLLVDEAQDTNPVLAGVLRRQDHLQRVLVGDSQQRLFSWRGSVDVMHEFDQAEVRYLTLSFRFGDAVAEEANRWLGYLEAPLRLRGLPSIDSRLDYVEQPDAVLCRTNADVMEQAMDAQDRGMDVAVVGGTREVYDFAGAVDDLRAHGRTSHRELSIFKSWSDVLGYVREEQPGGGFGTAVRLIERYGTDVVRSVATRCVEPTEADLVVSTVHKVKGLEWPKVLLDSNLAPDQALDQEDMSRGALMVCYVAATRAQEVLDATALELFHSRRRRRREAVEQT